MEFTKILKNPNRIDKNQISYLRSIIDDFPYLQSARAIYLKALKDTKSFKFHGELKIVAAYTTERNVLFDYITNQEKIGTELTSEKADKAKESFEENVKKGKAALPPCHAFFQFYVHNNKLSCQLYQRSADIFLGVPFNIASYALLTEMIAHVCGYEPGDFVHTFGDAHIYNNHVEQLNLQLSREPRNLPKLKILSKIDNINDFKFEDFEISNYLSLIHI